MTRDHAILQAAATQIAVASTLLQGFSAQLTDLGDQEQLAALSSRLVEEAAHLRSLSERGLELEQERRDKASGVSESVHSDILLAVYDQRAVTERGASNIKWYNPNTPLGDASGSTRRTLKDGICFHHTAVSQGYGTHASRREFWQGILEREGGLLWTPEVEQADGSLVDTAWIVPPSGPAWEPLSAKEKADAWVRAMALADRYRGFKPGGSNSGAPYHVVSAANSVLVLNLPFDWVTWHGNGANTRFLGFGWDADSRKDKLDAADVARDVEVTIELGRQEGHFAKGLEFTCHCAWTNKPTDPGVEFIEMLLELAPRVGATVDLDFKISPTARSLREVLKAA